jgi:hypothetical protein
LAEWHMGLRDTPPEKLPAQYAQLELTMQQRSQQLREQQFKFDRGEATLMQRGREMNMAFELTRNGVPPDMAIGAAQQYLQTGEMPPGVNLAKGLETQLQEMRLEQMSQEMQQGVVDDPEVENLFKLVQQMPMEHRTGSPQYKRLMSIMGQRFKWNVGQELAPGFWNKAAAWASFGVMGQRRDTISGPAAGAPPTAAPTTPGTPPAAAPRPQAQWTPELESSVKDVTIRAQGLFLNNTPAGRQRAFGLLREARDAYAAKDVAKITTALEKLELEMRVVGTGTPQGRR